MAITVSSPAGSRGTRLRLPAVASNVEKTYWEIDPDSVGAGGIFTIITTSAGSTSPNAISSDLDILDIWLPPFHDYSVRTRHRLRNDQFTEWTDSQTFTSRGPLNSFEKYQALSGISGVDNVVTE